MIRRSGIALRRARRPAQIAAEARPPMTICIAALYRHIYEQKLPEGLGWGILTASDRMWTLESLDIEYEPTQGKWSNLTERMMLLVADDISVHSDLIQWIKAHIAGQRNLRVREIAEQYGENLRQLRAVRASQYALSLYGLTAETFIEKQRYLDPNIVTSFDSAMQQYENRIKAQALIVGFDPDDTAHIYHVDNDGIAHCYDDIGFACIGIGRSHANSQFALRSYSNVAGYYQALLMIFAAKKSAEVAPGVGVQTDMHQIIKSGIFRLHDRTRASLDKIYAKYDKQRQRMEANAVVDLVAADRQNMEDERKALAKGASSSAQPSTVLAGQQTKAPSEAPLGGRRDGTPLRSGRPRSARRAR